MLFIFNMYPGKPLIFNASRLPVSPLLFGRKPQRSALRIYARH